VIDADKLDRVVDVIDEIPDGGGRITGYRLSISASFSS
jgi:hypothetical protein